MDGLALKMIIDKYVSGCALQNNRLWSDPVAFRISWNEAAASTEEEFAQKLNALRKWTSFVDDSRIRTPFRFLCECSTVEPVRVQNCLNELFNEDECSIDAKQSKIDHYIAETERLRMQYKPESRIRANDQRSAMALLWLYDPDSNYFLSPKASKLFAKSIGLNEKWGTNTNFKLKIYCQFCDEVIDQLRRDKTLMDFHLRRFDGSGVLHPDKNLHILLADLITATSSNPKGKGMD